MPDLSSIFSSEGEGGDAGTRCMPPRLTAARCPWMTEARTRARRTRSVRTVGIQLDPSIHLHNEVSGGWEDADGTTHSWSRTDDVSVHADAGVVFSVVGAVYDGVSA